MRVWLVLEILFSFFCEVMTDIVKSHVDDSSV